MIMGKVITFATMAGKATAQLNLEKGSHSIQSFNIPGLALAIFFD
jgi:hypothetical protein